MIDKFHRYIIYGRHTCSYCRMAVDLLELKEKESVFFDFFDDPEALDDDQEILQFRDGTNSYKE